MATPSAEIIRRRPNIDFGSATVPIWHRPGTEIADFLNAVSFVFPPGERFFIQSVRQYQDQIKDPVLKEQVRDFIFQEAMHSREHSRWNAVLSETFKHGKLIEERVAAGLARVSRYMPKSSQLAFTCALEHFTAILSDALLHWQESFIVRSDPAFAAMWLWHAVEEAEHKAVCFDLYQQVCGKGVVAYLHRVAAMMAASGLFMFAIFISLRALRQAEREANTGKLRPTQEAAPAPAEAKPAADPASERSAWQLLKEIVPLKLYFDYYRPSFHPANHDSRELIEEWKRRYRDFGVRPGMETEALDSELPPAKAS